MKSQISFINLKNLNQHKPFHNIIFILLLIYPYFTFSRNLVGAGGGWVFTLPCLLNVYLSNYKFRQIHFFTKCGSMGRDFLSSTPVGIVRIIRCLFAVNFTLFLLECVYLLFMSVNFDLNSK